jgi:hypothetical protein
MEITFDYKSIKIIMKSNLNEFLKDIIKKFEDIIEHKESLLYVYQWEKINLEKNLYIPIRQTK